MHRAERVRHDSDLLALKRSSANDKGEPDYFKSRAANIPSKLGEIGRNRGKFSAIRPSTALLAG